MFTHGLGLTHVFAGRSAAGCVAAGISPPARPMIALGGDPSEHPAWPPDAAEAAQAQPARPATSPRPGCPSRGYRSTWPLGGCGLMVSSSTTSTRSRRCPHGSCCQAS